MSRKLSVILICIVIVISLGISIYIPNRNKIQEAEDTSINYKTVEIDGKLGIVEGEKIIIKPQYDEIIILNPHRAVFVCRSGETQKIINENNKEIFTEYNNVEPIEIVENKYERNALKYENDGKFGLLSIIGNVITDAKYEEMMSVGYKEGELLIKQNGKYGIINTNGTTKIKNKYDEIQLDEYYTEENEYKKSGYIVRVTTNDGYRYGYYDQDGVQVLDEQYNQVTRLTQIKNDNIYLIAAKNGQCGVFVNNSKIINTEYQSIEYNTELKMFLVERTGKFGAINLNGTKILEPEYTELTINGIYLYGINDESKKVFDEQGKEVNISYDTVISKTTNPKYFIRNDAGNYSISNANFEKITNHAYKFIEHAYDTYFIVTNEQDKIGIIDLEEKIVVEFKYDLIQPIKGKNIIQAIDFSTNKTDIFDNEFDLALEMTNANIEHIEDGIKVYNEEQEVLLNDSGKFITE